MQKFAAISATDRLRVKTQFKSQVLNETARKIREDQNRVADDWNLFETGAMKSMLQGHFTVDATDESAALRMSYLNYFRFLDMPDPRRQMRRAKREGYHTYNRIVFGVLYNYGLPELAYGFTEEVYNEMTAEIDRAISSNNRYKRAGEMLHGISETDRNMAATMSRSLRQGTVWE